MLTIVASKIFSTSSHNYRNIGSGKPRTSTGQYIFEIIALKENDEVQFLAYALKKAQLNQLRISCIFRDPNGVHYTVTIQLQSAVCGNTINQTHNYIVKTCHAFYSYYTYCLPHLIDRFEVMNVADIKSRSGMRQHDNVTNMKQHQQELSGLIPNFIVNSQKLITTIFVLAMFRHRFVIFYQYVRV